jgi:LysR family hydrogen peroxide-inducible transcriptional activator
LELHQLRYFCAVARAGSFTRAADEEGIAQPSLSQQIHKLEADVGAPLFERLGRSVRLTPFGEALLPEATAILRRLADAQSLLASLQKGTRGRLRIGAIPTILPYFLAPRLHDFAARYPEVQLHLIEDVTRRLMDRLLSGELDIAVASLPVRVPDIVCSELFREPLLAAVPRRHPLAGCGAVNLAEVHNERLLLLKEGHCFREDVLTACTRARAQFRSVFESDHFAGIFPLVASGFGISIVPEMTSDAAGECELVPLSRRAVRRIGYLRARRHIATRALRAFIEWLRAASPGPQARSVPES